ncbi:Gfo/Idh/MocA family oxidoreductase [uncultured Paludibaculum sp.]|uniref:Gfo/Idh/MocA family protein n=1 Tax=uncultured Paludibaculum sp. TaxID=1765020 RepID=UPI002AAB5605|nr:Gfo/Idh/MocA family oxidoreductase [uncultured Paludibaculum sp.]
MSEPAVLVAVAGAGAFGKNHLRVIRESHVELAGVYDLDPERARAAAAEFGCRAYDSLEDLAGHAQAAIVAVPTSAHRTVACQLLEAGLDILVEKPIAPSVAEAHDMIVAARQHGRILQVGHLERFNPAVAAARKLVTFPLFFEIHRLSIFSPRSLDVDVVLDLMIHDLDILLAMTGAMPSEVRAAGIPVLSDKADIANVRLEFPSGCIANLTASRVSTEKVRKLRFFQPRQYISVDYAKQECFGIGVDDNRQVKLMPQMVTKQEPLKRQFESFLECIATRAKPDVDGEAAAQALELACIIMEKIAEHGAVVARSLASTSKS